MRKLYSLVLLGLLASTNPIFAMDEAETLGVEINEFSSFVPGAKGTAKVAPEGDDVPWYDDEVASGSLDARGRSKSIDKSGEGWQDGEDLLEELETRSSEGVQDPSAASVMAAAATHKAKLSLAEMAAEDDALEGETPTAVAAPMETYFESVPDRDTAELILRGLLKDKNIGPASYQLKSALSSLFPLGEITNPKADFDFNDFARKLKACDTGAAQRRLLTEIEDEHAEAW